MAADHQLTSSRRPGSACAQREAVLQHRPASVAPSTVAAAADGAAAHPHRLLGLPTHRTATSAPAVQRQPEAGVAAATAEAAQPLAAASPGGLPVALRLGLEARSGFDLSGVRVHRNSALPARLQAHAYATGSEIHLAPGRERDLPHEAWHLVQQRSGRVRSTTRVAGTPINDDPALEREADEMGRSAERLGAQHLRQGGP